jgi:c(7)-type cytochrome triheme protein
VKRSITAAAIAAAVIAAIGLAAAVALAADPAPALRLPADRTYDKAKDSPGPVVFSHQSHVAIADNKCTGCHPAPFRMLRPGGGMTHDEMNAGRLCGTCHDGKTASGVKEACDHCHQAPKGATTGSKGGGA